MSAVEAFAAAPPGFADLVESELRGLGLEGLTATPDGVAFEGGWEDVYRANLHSRVAGRVLVRVVRFHAATFRALERGLGEVAWEAWLPGGVALRPRVSARKSRLNHTGKIAEILLGAVEKRHRAPARAPGEEEFDLFLRIERDEVTVSIDTSGELLHRRGYRALAGRAPLRENLAAGCLLRLGYDGAEALLDPCCGSGTFAVEAAFIATRTPPGIFRHFAFEKLPGFDPGLWRKVREEALAAVLPAPGAPIFASDIDLEAVRLAAASAREAGFSQNIQVAVSDLRELDPPADAGLLVANPPYGVRLSGGGVYPALSRLLRGPFRSWRFGVIFPQDAARRGFRVGTEHRFTSGGIPLSLCAGGPGDEQ